MIYYFKLLIKTILLLISLIFSLLEYKLIGTGYIVNILMKCIKWCGVVPIKFTQWICGQYYYNYKKNNRPYLIEQSHNFFENCGFHDEYHTFKLLKNIPLKIKNMELKSSGSIGQVYRGEIDNNKKVAIKVKHPYCNENINFFIPIIRFFLYLGEKLKFKIPIDIDFFVESLLDQCNFNKEASYLKKFGSIYENNNYVIIPEHIYSDNDVLIMSWEDGDFYEEIQISEYKKIKILMLLTIFFRNSLLINKIVHCDLHPGNWKVRKYENNYSLVIYDFGLCCDKVDDSIIDFLYNKDCNNYDEAANIYYKNMIETKNNKTDIVLAKIKYYLTKHNEFLFNIIKLSNDYGLIIKGHYLCILLGFINIINHLDRYKLIDEYDKYRFKNFYLNMYSLCEEYGCFDELKKDIENKYIPLMDTNY